MVIFAGHLSDRIKYFVSQNEILLVLTDRPALFVKTGLNPNLSMLFVVGNLNKHDFITQSVWVILYVMRAQKFFVFR